MFPNLASAKLTFPNSINYLMDKYQPLTLDYGNIHNMIRLLGYQRAMVVLRILSNSNSYIFNTKYTLNFCILVVV
jgi:hypothetical protein